MRSWESARGCRQVRDHAQGREAGDPSMRGWRTAITAQGPGPELSGLSAYLLGRSDSVSCRRKRPMPGAVRAATSGPRQSVHGVCGRTRSPDSHQVTPFPAAASLASTAHSVRSLTRSIPTSSRGHVGRDRSAGMKSPIKRRADAAQPESRSRMAPLRLRGNHHWIIEPVSWIRACVLRPPARHDRPPLPGSRQIPGEVSPTLGGTPPSCRG